MKKSNKKRKKIISIGKIAMLILSILAGPLELLTIYLIAGNKESTGFFKFLGITLAFVICFVVLQFILMIIFNHIDKNFNDGCLKKSCLISFISIFASWFVMLKLFTDNGIGTIIFVLIILFIPHLLLLTLTLDGGSSESSNKSSTPSKKKEHIKFKRAYIKDAFGNIKGTADTVSFSDELGGFETTEYKDNSGNVTGKIDKY